MGRRHRPVTLVGAHDANHARNSLHSIRHASASDPDAADQRKLSTIHTGIVGIDRGRDSQAEVEMQWTREVSMAEYCILVRQIDEPGRVHGTARSTTIAEKR